MRNWTLETRMLGHMTCVAIAILLLLHTVQYTMCTVHEEAKELLLLLLDFLQPYVSTHTLHASR